jgi:hypothetical protein
VQPGNELDSRHIQNPDRGPPARDPGTGETGMPLVADSGSILASFAEVNTAASRRWLATILPHHLVIPFAQIILTS